MKYLLFICLHMSAFFVFCQTAPVKHNTQFVQSAEALHFIQEHAQTQILDVRTPAEWHSGAVKGAHKINFNDANFATLAASQLDKARPVFIYCAAGGRSAQATKVLENIGFLHIINCTEGFSALKNAGAAIE